MVEISSWCKVDSTNIFAPCLDVYLPLANTYMYFITLAILLADSIQKLTSGTGVACYRRKNSVYMKIVIFTSQ